MKHDRLLSAEDNWVTDIGAWFAGDTVILRGRDVFKEFDHFSWIEFLLFTVTGREFTANQVKFFNHFWMLGTSYPDPRIWNNRIAALAGASRATGVLGVAAATAVSEAKVYGKQADMRAYDFLERFKTLQDNGADIASEVMSELKQKRFIGGFGRPLISGDERIPPFLKLLRELELDHGPYVKLALQVNDILQNSRFRMSINIGGLAAAVSCDQGLSREEYYNYMMFAFSIGHVACYQDAKQHPEGSFFPLRCARIDYKGVMPRHWK